MTSLADFVLSEVALAPSGGAVVVVRAGGRTNFGASARGRLADYLAGQLPYYYRTPDAIAADFRARHDALEMIVSLVGRLPDSESHRQSHAGEILGSLYLEKVGGLKRLYSKLTLLTAEDTNAYKMDGLFVDTSASPFSYLAVEAKSSVLPTAKTKFRGHRYGILKQLIASLEKFSSDDLTFDLTAARDHLESGSFSDAEAVAIRADFVPPGPERLTYLGMATINGTTQDQTDDDYILSEPCTCLFDFRSLTVHDLAGLADEAYARLARVLEAAKRV